MGKYGDLIKQGKSGKPDNQQSGQQDVSISGKPDDQIASKPERQVNLCVKVPESWRRHWAAHSKLAGETMTETIVEALSAKYGLPENQN
jgi:hypothetical protein